MFNQLLTNCEASYNFYSLSSVLVRLYCICHSSNASITPLKCSFWLWILWF